MFDLIRQQFIYRVIIDTRHLMPIIPPDILPKMNLLRFLGLQNSHFQLLQQILKVAIIKIGF